MEHANDTAGLLREGMLAFARNDFTDSIATLTRVIDRDPAHRLAIATRGAAYLQIEEPSAARVDFDRVLDLDPDHARTHHLRGLAFEKEGEEARALADFDRALELDPEYGVAYYSRATLHTRMGNAGHAAEDIRMVTHLTQRNIDSFAAENNVWQSRQMQLEATLETELER